MTAEATATAVGPTSTSDFLPALRALVLRRGLASTSLRPWSIAGLSRLLLWA
jgi:hypothetical protein